MFCESTTIVAIPYPLRARFADFSTRFAAVLNRRGAAMAVRPAPRSASAQAPEAISFLVTCTTTSESLRAAKVRLRFIGRAIVQVIRKPVNGLAESCPALISENTPQDGNTV